MFIPSAPDIQALLRQYGLEGITYKNGIPDFSPFALETVEIFNMHGGNKGRDYNFPVADEMSRSMNGLTQAEATSMRGMDYTWHECNNMRTMQLTPSEINAYFKHMGGVEEINLYFELFNSKKTWRFPSRKNNMVEDK